MKSSIEEVLRYKGLIKQLTVRDLKLRYERSALGFLWSLLNPLTMIAIYTIFFSFVIRMGVENYPVFLVAVLLPWNFLSKGLLSVSLLPYQNGYLLNRAAFPAESLVFSGMLSSFADFAMEMLIFVLILTAIGMLPFPGVLALPFLLVLHFMFATGVALIFSVANVYYRDTQYVAGLVTTAWMYMTPVFYPVSMVPEKFQTLYKLNPMVGIAQSFRDALYFGKIPDMANLVPAVAAACIVFLFGWMFFNKHKKEFAELV